MAGEQGLSGLSAVLAAEVAAALETAPELLPLMPEVLRDLPDLGGGAGEAVLAALAELGLARGARVLDLGCGRGELAIALARDLGADVTGVDGFPPFIAAARSAAAAAGLACRFVQGDLREAVGTARGFDAVLLVSVGPVLGDHAATMAAIRATVRPGGWVVVADACVEGAGPLPPVYAAHVDRATTERRLESCGDRLVLARSLRPEVVAWNALAMPAIRGRVRALAARHPDLAPALRAYLEGQEAEVARLETGPLAPMLWVLERSG